MAAARRRPGTPPKGDRSAITVRVPRSHRSVYEQAAAQQGLPLSDYIGVLLARAHELQDPDYVHRGHHEDQEELRLVVGA